MDRLDAASNDTTENALTECVHTPRRSREHAMKRSPMTSARDVRCDEGGRDGVGPLREYPAGEDDDEADEARTSQRGPEALFPDRAQPAIVHARGSLLENVW